MAHLSEITDPDSVLKAIAECERLGRTQFLEKYGFREAREYFLKRGSRRYDSKAILGAAYGYEHPAQGPLTNQQFSGGEKTVARRLGKLGFTVVFRKRDGTEIALEQVSSLKMTAGLGKAAALADAEGEFNPADDQDARERILARIAKRQGQPQFRSKLLKVYGGRCAITGCDCIEALEAAHIYPYRGIATNHITNGLLLRSDLHALFDLGLIGIASATHTVLVSKAVEKTDYGQLAGKRLRLPSDLTHWPNSDVLDKHRDTFGL